MYANISMPHVNYISAIYGSLNCMAGSKYLSGIITLSHFTLYLRICPHETSKKLIAVYINLIMSARNMEPAVIMQPYNT